MKYKIYNITNSKKCIDFFTNGPLQKYASIFDFYNYNLNQFKKEFKNYNKRINEEKYIILVFEDFNDILTGIGFYDFLILLEKGIYFYLLSNNGAGTCRWNFRDEKFEFDTLETIDSKIDLLKEIYNSLIDNKNTKRQAMISDDFIADYWSWQLGEKSTNDIMADKNRSYSFTTNSQFYSLAKRYEQTPNYWVEQKKCAQELVKLKKRGKVDGNLLADIIVKNKNEYLTPDIMRKIMKTLKINHIDLWRCLLTFSLAKKKYDTIEDCKLKQSINTVLKIIETPMSKFFVEEESIDEIYESDYNKMVSKIIKRIK